MDRSGRSHRDYRLLAAAAVDGRIAPDDAVALEAHLATCESCRADQRAMLADHAWLATPARVAPPNPRVRAAVLDAARSHRVPRTSDARRPWTALAAAAAVLVLVTGGLILAGTQPPDDSTPASASPSVGPSASLQPSAAIGLPRVEGSGTLMPVEGNGPQRQFEVSIGGGIIGPPSGVFLFTDANGDTWTGTITAAGYWSELNRGARLALIQGCVEAPVCRHVRIELLDSTVGGADQIRLAFPDEPLIDPAVWQEAYEVVDGSVTVTGDAPSLAAITALAGEMPTLPSDLTPYLQVDGAMTAEGFVGTTIAVDGTVIGGVTGRVGDAPRPIVGHVNFSPSAGTGWTLAPLSVEYWNDVTTRPGVTVAFVQGCVVAPTCTPVAVMFVDNEDTKGFDPVYVGLGWALPAGAPGEQTLHYSIQDSALRVAGCMVVAVQAQPQRSILPDERC